MIEKSLTRTAELFDRHDRAITIGAALWFWAGIAVYARFIELPDIPRLVRDGFFWASVAVNAIWWAALKPAIEKRRKPNASKDAIAKTPDA
ncbi:MAG: hypothetical protein AAGK01_03235 [Pseudomonadota bacterium]